MTTRIKWALIGFVVTTILTLGAIWYCYEPAPKVAPKFRVGQVVARRMGSEQGIVMERWCRGGKYSYKVKHYFKLTDRAIRYDKDVSIVRTYKEFELYVPR